MDCCGVVEISGIGHYAEPAIALDELVFANQLHRRYGLIIFTGAIARTGAEAAYAIRFRDYIVENNLGEVSTSGQARNPNSGNTITAYVWKPNRKGITAWRRRASTRNLLNRRAQADFHY